MCTYTQLVPLNQRVLNKVNTFITFLAFFVDCSLLHWYQQCLTVHHVPKCTSCHKPIVVVNRRAHCFYDCIYGILRCFAELLERLFTDQIYGFNLRLFYCCLLCYYIIYINVLLLSLLSNRAGRKDIFYSRGIVYSCFSILTGKPFYVQGLFHCFVNFSSPMPSTVALMF